MRIAQINAVYEFSSTGRTTKELHEELLRQGHQSVVFNSTMHDPAHGIYQIGDTHDHKVHALKSRVLGLQGYHSRWATKAMLSQLLEFKPDVVVLRNLHANYINLPLLLEWLARHDVATVVVLHDFWFMTGHCCHYTQDNCYKWLTECHDCPILHKYNRSLFFDRSRKIFRDKLRLFQALPRLAVVGVSDWVTNEARRSPIFARARKITRIYNWVDLDPFKPMSDDSLRDELHLSENDFVVLGVSQHWTPEKGLTVFRNVAMARPELKFVLVGGYSRSLDYPDNMLMVGAVNSPRELARYYSIADVFLNPSIQETFGKVSAEALACGTPVITNNATACPEIIGPDCGIVVHDNHPAQILAALDHITHLGKPAYQSPCIARAQNLYSKTNNINQYISLFHSL